MASFKAILFDFFLEDYSADKRGPERFLRIQKRDRERVHQAIFSDPSLAYGTDGIGSSSVQSEFIQDEMFLFLQKRDRKRVHQAIFSDPSLAWGTQGLGSSSVSSEFQQDENFLSVAYYPPAAPFIPLTFTRQIYMVSLKRNDVLFGQTYFPIRNYPSSSA